MNKCLFKTIMKLRHLDMSKFKETQIRVEKEYVSSIPEIKVVDAVKEYIDGLWAPEDVQEKLWQALLKSIKELDEKKMAG